MPSASARTHSSSARTRFLVWIAAVLTLVIGGALWLWTLRHGRTSDQTALLVFGWLGLGSVAFALVRLLETTPADAIRLPRGRSELYILLACAGLLAATLLLWQPTLSDDHRRYLFEGGLVLAGQSPYAPATTRPQTVPHAELASVYPPVAQSIFALSAWLGGEWALRALLAVAALGVVAALLLMLRREGASAWWAGPVALTPLLYVETAGSPHVDVAGVLLLLLCLLAHDARRSIWAGALLALAAGVKPQVVLLLPFLCRDRRLAPTLAGFALAAVPQLALLLPHRGLHGFLHSFSAYSTRWEANGSVFELLKSLATLSDDPRAVNRLKDLGRMLGPLLLVPAFWCLWKLRARPVAAAYTLQLILLLCSPIVYPWYALWVLCLAPLLRAGTWTAWTLAATLGLSYTLGRGWSGSVGWTSPLWVLLLQYIPVYLALFRDWTQVWRIQWERA
jgi:hypothetical protein